MNKNTIITKQKKPTYTKCIFSLLLGFNETIALEIFFYLIEQQINHYNFHFNRNGWKCYNLDYSLMI